MTCTIIKLFKLTKIMTQRRLQLNGSPSRHSDLFFSMRHHNLVLGVLIVTTILDSIECYTRGEIVSFAKRSKAGSVSQSSQYPNPAS